VSTPAEAIETIVDRLTITDLVNAYLNNIDRKNWPAAAAFFTDDAVVSFGADMTLEGRAAIMERTLQANGTDEVITHHHAASFSPVVDGDTAHAQIHLRAMHFGTGPREGSSYESLGFLDTSFARTPDGWRCDGYEWRILVKLGDFTDLFGYEGAGSR
jgi:ketosteroid isomerase-like protein